MFFPRKFLLLAYTYLKKIVCTYCKIKTDDVFVSVERKQKSAPKFLTNLMLFCINTITMLYDTWK